MQEPNHLPEIDLVLKSYQKIFPNFKFPENFPENRKIETLKKSRGRKIIFSKQNDDYRVFFEDSETETADIPKWNKLIGCGG